MQHGLFLFRMNGGPIRRGRQHGKKDVQVLMILPASFLGAAGQAFHDQEYFGGAGLHVPRVEYDRDREAVAGSN